MYRLKIKKMNNTFGIRSLDINSNDKSLYQCVIYSSNGSFKTSFSRALFCLSSNLNDEIEDRLLHKSSEIDIELVDEKGNFYSNNLTNRVIVFSREIYEEKIGSIDKFSNELSSITVDIECKKKLNNLINSEFAGIIKSLENSIKSIGLSGEKVLQFLTGKNIDSLNITDLETVLSDIKNVKCDDISKIVIKNIFTKAYEPIDSVSFIENANNYSIIIRNRLKEELFDETFNDSNCMQFIDMISRHGFLNEDKHRGLYINGDVYYDVEKIRGLFDDAIKKLSVDPDVLAACNDLVKSMGNSAEAKKLKKQIKDDILLVNQLALGRKNIINIALNKTGIDVDDYLEQLNIIKEQYTNLISKASSIKSQFENAINIYRTRFRPIFDIQIVNKKESILGLETPSIEFIHNRAKDVRLKEDDLRDILSSGEKTVLNIISFIVEYEAKKVDMPIIVLDDIVETFDYANRFAFIEYINDIIDNGNITIVLTHNYEFYNTIRNRIYKLDDLTAYSDDGKVRISKNKNINFNLENVLNIDSIKKFFVSIPYFRMIKTMIKEDTSLFDNCLHYKRDTPRIRIKDFSELLDKKYINCEINHEDKYLDLLKKTADKLQSFDSYNIIDKTVLAIACRVVLEEKIINNNFTIIDGINKNQLATIRKRYKDSITEKALELIDKVQLSTPEFIHGNSFIYEPLIDINGNYLLEIYNEVKDLDVSSIWK